MNMVSRRKKWGRGEQIPQWQANIGLTPRF